MSKGSRRRDAKVSEETIEKNWERIFGSVNGKIFNKLQDAGCVIVPDSIFMKKAEGCNKDVEVKFIKSLK